MLSLLHQTVSIPIHGHRLEGELVIPPDTSAVVLFAHGSGSSRLSPRNQRVASILHQHGIGTLLFDLLTQAESKHYDNRFNIDLLASRLIAATNWLRQLPESVGWRLVYFGASTGAAAALKAAAMKAGVAAVVSRGGRPDLCNTLSKVSVPVLLLVGGLDKEVIQLNELACAQLSGKKKLIIIEGASHLFEEPGKLEEVAEIAAAWLTDCLGIQSPISN